MKKKIIVFSTNDFFKKNLKIKNIKIYFYNKKSKLNLKNLSKLNPDIVFFPYWHWKVEKKFSKIFMYRISHITTSVWARRVTSSKSNYKRYS